MQGGASMIIMLVLLFGMMYFMLIRPQKKQQQKHQNMMSTLKPGDEVITIGRLHGVVDEVNNEERTVVLNCEGIYLTFDLNAIASVNKPSSTATASANQSTEELVESTEDTAVEANKNEETKDESATDEEQQDSSEEAK